MPLLTVCLALYALDSFEAFLQFVFSGANMSRAGSSSGAIACDVLRPCATGALSVADTALVVK
jgi:hypothetical protein